MICVKSFVCTRILDKVSINNDVECVVQEATKETQEWIRNSPIRVISTSTQPIVSDRFVSYVITVVAEQVG